MPDYLQRAIDNGKDPESFMEDPAFDTYHEDKGFQALVGA